DPLVAVGTRTTAVFDLQGHVVTGVELAADWIREDNEIVVHGQQSIVRLRGGGGIHWPAVGVGDDAVVVAGIWHMDIGQGEDVRCGTCHGGAGAVHAIGERAAGAEPLVGVAGIAAGGGDSHGDVIEGPGDGAKSAGGVGDDGDRGRGLQGDGGVDGLWAAVADAVSPHIGGTAVGADEVVASEGDGGRGGV